MSDQQPGEIAETEIRRLLDDFAAALRASDIGGVMSIHAQDVLSFDLVPNDGRWSLTI